MDQGQRIHVPKALPRATLVDHDTLCPGIHVSTRRDFLQHGCSPGLPQDPLLRPPCPRQSRVSPLDQRTLALHLSQSATDHKRHPGSPTRPGRRKTLHLPPMSGRFPRGGPLSAIPQEGAAVNRAHSPSFTRRPPPPACAPCRAQPYTYALATPTTTPRPLLPPPTGPGLSLPPPKQALSPCLIHRGKCPIVAP